MKHATQIVGAPIVGLALLLFCLVAPSGAQAQSFSDDQFVDGDWGTELCPNVPLVIDSSFVVSQDISNGNAAPSRHVEHNYDLRIHLCQLRVGAIVAPSQNAIAALDFSLDGRYDDRANTSDGCFAYGPLIRQGGTYFRIERFWQSCNDQDWQSTTSSLLAEDFVRVDMDERADIQHPNFSCGAEPIELGLISANQVGGTVAVDDGRTTEGSLDNWNAWVEAGDSCTPPPPPPAPYQCYDILDHSQDLNPNRLPTVDQFGEMNVRVGHPVALCNPASVGEAYRADQTGEETHYVCYQVMGAARERVQRVEISNDLDQGNIMVIAGRDMVCLPSHKRVIERAEE